MRELGARHGWPSAPRHFGGTIGIIEPEGFLRACVPWFEELLGPESLARLRFSTSGEAVTIAGGDEQLALPDMEAFTRLVFLRRDRREELELDLPPESELRRLLDRVFPLPLVGYGLNFI
jgi:hypothetical protein